MKRFTAYLLAAIMCFGMVAFTSCTKKDETTDEPKQSTNTSGENTDKKDADDTKTAEKTLVVGLDDAFPPMGFRDDKNEIVGFDVDMAREAIKRMGYTAKFQPIDWSNKILELNSSKIDFIWNGFTITDDRKKEVLFTKPYLENAQVLVVKADSGIKTKADLKDKKVASQTDSAGLEALNADKDLIGMIFGAPIEYADFVSALNDLKIGGRVDAIVVDLVVADYYLTKQPNTFKILDDHLSPEEYGVGVKKGNETLLNDLQKALDDMNKDGKAAEISKKWFGADKVLK